MKETKRYVLTGGPCCGKSTLIDNLEKKGHIVLKEIAREVIEQRGSFPKEKNEIIEFQKILFRKQLLRESQLRGSIVFLDRGIEDYLVYAKHLTGYIPNEFKIGIKERYYKIFILDRLPFEKDGLRIEKGDEEAEDLHQKIIQAYQNNGGNLVFVPIMNIEDRTNYILNKLK